MIETVRGGGGRREKKSIFIYMYSLHVYIYKCTCILHSIGFNLTHHLGKKFTKKKL